jgi:hypothetical protein
MKNTSRLSLLLSAGVFLLLLSTRSSSFSLLLVLTPSKSGIHTHNRGISRSSNNHHSTTRKEQQQREREPLYTLQLESQPSPASTKKATTWTIKRRHLSRQICKFLIPKPFEGRGEDRRDRRCFRAVCETVPLYSSLPSYLAYSTAVFIYAKRQVHFVPT